ncbi:hypothetical protein [Algoriphagus formosus]|uniref:hypothetical protein n=1 Tax=Algoriphagus formosus TaxID=2007308 RepID=UPI000C2902C6|nr:hypothetical protein [Algoriphagus formosus]
MKNYFIGLLVLLLFLGGSLLTAIGQSSNSGHLDVKFNFGNELTAGELGDVDAICYDINGQPVPPICKITFNPDYREYYGVPYLCLA